jgi:hypothetical protein
MATKTAAAMSNEEEEFLRKSNHRPKQGAEMMIDVHGNAHKVSSHHKDAPISAHTPSAPNFLTSSDRVNHRFSTTNDVSYRPNSGSRSRSNSPGRVPVHHRKSDSPARRGSGNIDSPRSGSPAGAKRSSTGGHPTAAIPQWQAEEMVAKMLEASIDRVKHK